MTGNELKKKRILLNLTQEELAKRCGITKQALSSYEKEANCDKKISEPLSRVLEIELGKKFVETDADVIVHNFLYAIGKLYNIKID